MWIFYIIACIPVIIGAILWTTNKNIVWKEWLISTVLSFIFAGILHLVVIDVMTADFETWSGWVKEAVYIPEWIEEYTESHSSTDSKGNTRYWTTIEHRTHYQEWVVQTTIGKFNVSSSKWEEIKHNFGGTILSKIGSRPGYDGGDKNNYYIQNTTKYIEPVNKTCKFRNMFKASQNVMSFPKVPENIEKKKSLYEYPKNPDYFISGRLLGKVNNKIPIKEWDQMNARIGAAKKVNVIIIEFGKGLDDMYAKWQEAKWLGGKKNDIVLCYGIGDENKVAWAYVFGWTEKSIVKRNLETLLLTSKIDNSILPQIEQEIKSNYQIKNWHKFDYLTLYPPMCIVIIFSILLLIFQIGYWCWAIQNDEVKN